jgi:hypothetical protein
VYVAGQENVVEKFSSTGTSLGRLKTATSSVGGVAVHATGSLGLDSSSANVGSFSNALVNVEVTSISLHFECASLGAPSPRPALSVILTPEGKGAVDR